MRKLSFIDAQTRPLLRGTPSEAWNRTGRSARSDLPPELDHRSRRIGVTCHL